MDNDIKVIGIEVDGLISLIRDIVREELQDFEERMKESRALENPLSDKMMINDLAKFLDVSRHTITNYKKSGILPQPKLTLSGRPYWDKEEVIACLKANDMAWKYNL